MVSVACAVTSGINHNIINLLTFCQTSSFQSIPTFSLVSVFVVLCYSNQFQHSVLFLFLLYCVIPINSNIQSCFCFCCAVLFQSTPTFSLVSVFVVLCYSSQLQHSVLFLFLLYCVIPVNSNIQSCFCFCCTVLFQSTPTFSLVSVFVVLCYSSQLQHSVLFLFLLYCVIPVNSNIQSCFCFCCTVLFQSTPTFSLVSVFVVLCYSSQLQHSVLFLLLLYCVIPVNSNIQSCFCFCCTVLFQSTPTFSLVSVFVVLCYSSQLQHSVLFLFLSCCVIPVNSNIQSCFCFCCAVLFQSTPTFSLVSVFVVLCYSSQLQHSVLFLFLLCCVIPVNSNIQSCFCFCCTVLFQSTPTFSLVSVFVVLCYSSQLQHSVLFLFLSYCVIPVNSNIQSCFCFCHTVLFQSTPTFSLISVFVVLCYSNQLQHSVLFLFLLYCVIPVNSNIQSCFCFCCTVLFQSTPTFSLVSVFVVLCYSSQLQHSVLFLFLSYCDIPVNSNIQSCFCFCCAVLFQSTPTFSLVSVFVVLCYSSQLQHSVLFLFLLYCVIPVNSNIQSCFCFCCAVLFQSTPTFSLVPVFVVLCYSSQLQHSVLFLFLLCCVIPVNSNIQSCSCFCCTVLFQSTPTFSLVSVFVVLCYSSQLQHSVLFLFLLYCVIPVNSNIQSCFCFCCTVLFQSTPTFSLVSVFVVLCYSSQLQHSVLFLFLSYCVIPVNSNIQSCFCFCCAVLFQSTPTFSLVSVFVILCYSSQLQHSVLFLFLLCCVIPVNSNIQSCFCFCCAVLFQSTPTFSLVPVFVVLCYSSQLQHSVLFLFLLCCVIPVNSNIQSCSCFCCTVLFQSTPTFSLVFVVLCYSSQLQHSVLFLFLLYCVIKFYFCSNSRHDVHKVEP